MASGAVLESYLTFSHGLPTGLVQWCDRRGRTRGKAVGERKAGLRHGTCGRILTLAYH